MNIKNLEERIKNLHSEIKPRYKIYTNEEKDILYNTVKLNEEVGELCNDILAVLKLQRKSKLDKFDKRNIYEEFAGDWYVVKHQQDQQSYDICSPHCLELFAHKRVADWKSLLDRLDSTEQEDQNG